MKNHIFVIGYTCSGKTSSSKKVAKKFGLNLIDSDIAIENQQNISIQELFQKYGEHQFRTIESQYIKSLQHTEKSIISLGGGTPCFNDNILFLKSIGKVIFLNTNINFIIARLVKNHKKRPTIANVKEENLQSHIMNHYESRKLYYQQADYIVDDADALVNCVESLIENS